MLAGGVVGGLGILGAEGGPAMGTEHLVLGHIVHGDGDAQHGREGNQIGAHMAVNGNAVVGAPIGHDGINVLKGAFAGYAGREPGGGPGGVGTLIQDSVHLVGQHHRGALGDLQGGPRC